MKDNELLFPFFTEQEILENVYKIMITAQNEFFQRVNNINDARPDLTKEQFFKLLDSSPKLQGVLREAVKVAIKLIDWDTCLDIATSSMATKEKEQQKRQDNIKLI